MNKCIGRFQEKPIIENILGLVGICRTAFLVFYHARATAWLMLLSKQQRVETKSLKNRVFRPSLT